MSFKPGDIITRSEHYRNPLHEPWVVSKILGKYDDSFSDCILAHPFGRSGDVKLLSHEFRLATQEEVAKAVSSRLLGNQGRTCWHCITFGGSPCQACGSTGRIFG